MRMKTRKSSQQINRLGRLRHMHESSKPSRLGAMATLTGSMIEVAVALCARLMRRRSAEATTNSSTRIADQAGDR